MQHMHSNACIGSIVFDGSLIVESLEIVPCHANVESFESVGKPARSSLILIFSVLRDGLKK
jgi:hypothetical protein